MFSTCPFRSSIRLSVRLSVRYQSCERINPMSMQVSTSGPVVHEATTLIDQFWGQEDKGQGYRS